MTDRETIRAAIAQASFSGLYAWELDDMTDAVLTALRPEAQDGVASAAKVLLAQAPEGSAVGERWRHASNLLWTHRHVTDKGGK